jgi:hypothetical protein
MLIAIPYACSSPVKATEVNWVDSTVHRNTKQEGGVMAGRRRSDRALRDKLGSPGRPPVARQEHRRRFWALIAKGLSSEDAAMEVGVSPPVGFRWFRAAGGVAPSHLSPLLKPSSVGHLSFAEREEIALGRAEGLGVREVARRLGRAASTVAPERGDAERRAGLSGDDGAVACGAGGAAAETGEARDEPGAAILCAGAACRGRGWSWRACGSWPFRAVEGAAARAASGPSLGQGVEPAAARTPATARPSGRQHERTTRFTMLLHLPPMEGHGMGPREKNGPAPAGHGAEAVRDAITSTIMTLPEQLRRSLTWDQGAEMARHAGLRIDTGLEVYFCDPHSPWQRGTNENTNGLLRQYFPKGTDLSVHGPADLAAVAAALNGRPRQTLGWKTPAEALDAVLQADQGGVAMTD